MCRLFLRSLPFFRTVEDAHPYAVFSPRPVGATSRRPAASESFSEIDDSLLTELFRCGILSSRKSSPLAPLRVFTSACKVRRVEDSFSLFPCFVFLEIKESLLTVIGFCSILITDGTSSLGFDLIDDPVLNEDVPSFFRFFPLFVFGRSRTPVPTAACFLRPSYRRGRRLDGPPPPSPHDFFIFFTLC